MGKIKDMLGIGTNKIEKTDEVTKGMLDLYQNKCMGGSKTCPVSIVMYKKNWCGLSPYIKFNCPHRREISQE
jgi:hypothetical protein